MQNLSGAEILSSSLPNFPRAINPGRMNPGDNSFAELFTVPELPVYNPSLPELPPPGQNSYDMNRLQPEDNNSSAAASSKTTDQAQKDPAKSDTALEEQVLRRQKNASEDRADNLRVDSARQKKHDPKSADVHNNTKNTFHVENLRKVDERAGLKKRTEDPGENTPVAANTGPGKTIAPGKSAAREGVEEKNSTTLSNKAAKIQKSSDNTHTVENALKISNSVKEQGSNKSTAPASENLTVKKNSELSSDSSVTVAGVNEEDASQSQLVREKDTKATNFQTKNQSKTNDRLQNSRSNARGNEAASTVQGGAVHEQSNTANKPKIVQSTILENGDIGGSDANRLMAGDSGEQSFSDQNGNQSGNGTFSNTMFQNSSQTAAPQVNTSDLQVIFNLDSGILAETPAGNSSETAVNRQTMSANDLIDQFRQQMKGNFGSDLVRQAKYVLKGQNSGEINLILKPEKLGKVRIRMNLQDKSIAGKIFVENKTVEEAFKEVLTDLREAFLEQGFDDLNLEVSLDDASSRDAELMSMADFGNSAELNQQAADRFDSHVARARAYVKEFESVDVLA